MKAVLHTRGSSTRLIAETKIKPKSVVTRQVEKLLEALWNSGKPTWKV
ncbi:MAG: hypothetical protein H7Y37_17110 [Anaerolineae bacterium]|nr:hypothetical protein [Gloeobacterales cyanobacterium ES-bin-313]